MKKQEHLPMYGVGPAYGAVVLLATALGNVLTYTGRMPVRPFGPLRIPVAAVAAALILLGLWLWYSAVFRARVDEHIKENTLAAAGVYAWVRNPIYSAFLLAGSGALLLANNLWLLVLPPLYWLSKLHGDAYAAYCRRVNRCIPWFPKNEREGRG